MEKKKPTLKDIASLAAVSISTVSMVLRGDKSISSDVSQKVLQIASELGYEKKYNQHIEPRYITLIEYESFDYQWNFIKPFLLNLSAGLRENNIFSIVHHLDTEIQDIDGLEKAIFDSGSIAVCTIHYFNKDFFEHLQKRGIPVVILNNNVFQENFSSVCVDDFQGAYNGTSYLIQKGHRNFLYFDYHREDLDACVVDRYLGFKKAIDENAVQFEEKHRITMNLNKIKNDNTNIVIDSIKENPGTTAIFFHDDYLASKFIPSMKNNNIKIPEDLSIIAPGDTLDFSQAFTPQFTTLKIDTAKMGKMAADLIIEHINNPLTGPQHLKVTPQIMERGTCRQL